MPFIPKVPASCAELDLALVERVLAKYYGDIYAAARALGVSGSDLRRLTWAKPKLLESAHEAMDELVARAQGVVIEMLYSDDVRQQERASEIILASYLGRNSPFAPARRGRASGGGATVEYTIRWQDEVNK